MLPDEVPPDVVPLVVPPEVVPPVVPPDVCVPVPVPVAVCVVVTVIILVAPIIAGGWPCTTNPTACTIKSNDAPALKPVVTLKVVGLGPTCAVNLQHVSDRQPVGL